MDVNNKVFYSVIVVFLNKTIFFLKMGLLTNHEGGLASLLEVGWSEKKWLTGTKRMIMSKFRRSQYLKFIYDELGIMPHGASEEDGIIVLPDTSHRKEVLSANRVRKNKLATGDMLYEREIYHPNAHGIDGIKILVMSDFHFDHLPIHGKRIQAYTEAVSDKEIDLIFILGDLVYKGGTAIDVRFLSTINGKLGKYFVLGNHDYYGENFPEKIKDQMQKARFTDLTNTAALLDYNGNRIAICGLDDPIRGNPCYTQQLKEISEEPFNIMLVHALDGLTSELPNKFDLVASGHCHSGEFDFGFIDGIDALVMWSHYLNINGQKRGLQFLTDRTLSYIDPGASAHFRDRYTIGKLPLLPRFFTETQGISIITLHGYNP